MHGKIVPVRTGNGVKLIQLLKITTGSKENVLRFPLPMHHLAALRVPLYVAWGGITNKSLYALLTTGTRGAIVAFPRCTHVLGAASTSQAMVPATPRSIAMPQ